MHIFGNFVNVKLLNFLNEKIMHEGIVTPSEIRKTKEHLCRNVHTPNLWFSRFKIEKI